MKLTTECVFRMVGALAGDMAGSVYEFDNIRRKDFELFAPYHGNECGPTDDSVMTIAVAKALWESRDDALDLEENAVRCMREIGQRFPTCGYGAKFFEWMYSEDPKPYYSFGNGAAMRVSPVSYFATNLSHAEQLAEKVTCVTHNHPEGIKGAKVTAGLGYLALQGESKEALYAYAEKFYDISFSLDEIRPTYQFDVSCMGTVPQAIVAFLEAKDFEDAIRNAISIGGDSDTLAAIAGGIAGAYYGVPEFIFEQVILRLPGDLVSVIRHLLSVDGASL